MHPCLLDPDSELRETTEPSADQDDVTIWMIVNHPVVRDQTTGVLEVVEEGLDLTHVEAEEGLVTHVEEDQIVLEEGLMEILAGDVAVVEADMNAVEVVPVEDMTVVLPVEELTVTLGGGVVAPLEALEGMVVAAWDQDLEEGSVLV
jgi:hypothetical protein